MRVSAGDLTVPLYEYCCKKCEHTFEKIMKFSDVPEAQCPECGGEGKRLLSAPAVHFKGTGWYVTDYARKGQKAASKEGRKKPSDDKTSDSKKTSEDKKPSSGSKKSSSESKSSSSSSKKKD